jgi:hypothetical protein
MSSSVKGRKEIGIKCKGIGRLDSLHCLLCGTMKDGFQKKQCFATPPEVSAEWGALVEVQIIKSERLLLLQRQLWLQGQDFLLRGNAPR